MRTMRTITQVQETAVIELLAVKPAGKRASGFRHRRSVRAIFRRHNAALDAMQLGEEQIARSWFDVQDMVALERNAE